MQTIQIQQIAVSELQDMISVAVREEFKKFIPKQPTNKKTSIYGTRKEVAKELKISLPILTEHTKTGTLKGFRLGGRVLYKWEDVFNSLAEIQSLKYKHKTTV